jgi:HNH endonuclease
MTELRQPHFAIKENAQKGGASFRRLFSPTVLKDICERLTGQTDYTVEFDSQGYNVGRLALLTYGSERFYISLSETNIQSRNSSFQSLPSALSRSILDASFSKQICFYVHTQTVGNFETDYFMFMYRLMKTAGVRLLNIEEYVSQPIAPFAMPEDVIAQKDRLRMRSRANKSTYVSRGPLGEIEVYGKTYGASKYETTLICIALAKISPSGLDLYQVEEGDLASLPAISIAAIRASGLVSIDVSTAEIELAEFTENNSLRSIRYIYNLFERFEHKSCAFCECAIPQIVQGAHVWSVAAIKKSGLPLDDQLRHALDGHNGLWLCENHHKLFDSGLIMLDRSGGLNGRTSLSDRDMTFLKGVTTKTQLDVEVLSPSFLEYLSKRNLIISEGAYSAL